MLNYGYNHKYAGVGKRTVEADILPIRIAGVARESIVDGPELRYVVFTQGCPHNCKGCHNPETHDNDGGYLTRTDIIWRDIAKNPLLRGITFSGGEPFLWGRELAAIGRAAHDSGMTVMTYTGFIYEQLLKNAETDKGVRELLTVSDYLIDGPYIEEKRDLSLRFRGSSNQRILDVTCYPNSTAASVLSTL
jgi:anaerobic ribonucleoside-triphosphate reductase activating protein